MFKTKKAQSVGLISGLVFGIASLVIGVIIAYVMVSTLTNADLLNAGRGTFTVRNENGTGDGTATVFINSTGYALSVANTSTTAPGSFTILQAANYTTGTGTNVIPATNYTVTTAGVIFNSSTNTFGWDNVTLNYTYQKYTLEEMSSNALSDNMTKGVDNVSAKIPTVLLVAAIVLILGVLVLLVGAWQRMRLGGGGI